MEKNASVWSRKVSVVYTGVLLFSIAGIVGALHQPFCGLSGPAGSYNILRYAIAACMIAGYVLFYSGLGGLRTILSPEDSASVRRIRNGSALCIVAHILTAIALWPAIAELLNITAFFMMALGFMDLKNSPAFPPKARRGASNLFLSMIIGIVGIFVIFASCWIPVVDILGQIIGGLILVAAYILMLAGWGKIKRADPVS